MKLNHILAAALSALAIVMPAGTASAQIKLEPVDQPIPATITEDNGTTVITVLTEGDLERVAVMRDGHDMDSHRIIRQGDKAYDGTTYIMMVGTDNWPNTIQTQFALLPGHPAQIHPLGVTWDGSKLYGHKPVAFPTSFSGQLAGNEAFEIQTDGFNVSTGELVDNGNDTMASYTWGVMAKANDYFKGVVVNITGSHSIYRLRPSTRVIPQLPKSNEAPAGIVGLLDAKLRNGEHLTIDKVFGQLRPLGVLPARAGYGNGDVAKSGYNWSMEETFWAGTFYKRADGNIVAVTLSDFGWLKDGINNIFPTGGYEGMEVVAWLNDKGYPEIQLADNGKRPNKTSAN